MSAEESRKLPTVSSMVSSIPVKRDTLILNFQRPIMEAILRFRENTVLLEESAR